MGEKYKAEDDVKRKTIQAKNDLENMAYQIRNSMDTQPVKDEDKQKIQDLVKETIDWIDNNPNADLEEYEAKKKEIEEVYGGVVACSSASSAQNQSENNDGPKID